MRVLLVDDEEEVRAIVRRLIQQQTTFEVVGEASNGLEAIELVEVLQPDLVVMDVQLPKLDGIEATRRIKQRWPHIHVLAFAGDPAYVREMMEAGASGYLVKGGPTDRLIYSLGGVAGTRRIPGFSQDQAAAP
ncbi:MAG: response regulator [Actinomycetota bacterium]